MISAFVFLNKIWIYIYGEEVLTCSTVKYGSWLQLMLILMLKLMFLLANEGTQNTIDI